MPPPEITKLRLVRRKECKHSVVYGGLGAGRPFDTLYLKRTFAEKMPYEIEVTIQIIREGLKGKD